jgi:Fur family transcriptional regulator, ferric uptake regulator
MPFPTQSALNLYENKLKQAKTSDTLPRQAVFTELYINGHSPMTMARLITLTKDCANRASIYRAVKRLEEIGIIRRLNIGWKYKLELSDDFHGHHHHLTCTKCGATNATDDDEDFEKLLQDFAAKYGYTLSEHQLDIRGLCINCKNSGPVN